MAENNSLLMQSLFLFTEHKRILVFENWLTKSSAKIILLVNKSGAPSHFIHRQYGRILPHEQIKVLAGLVDLRLELVHPLPQGVLHLVPLVPDPGLGEVEDGSHVLGPVEDSGVELYVLLGQDGAVQQEENPLGCDADSLH